MGDEYRDEIEEATQEFLSDGGRVEYLEEVSDYDRG